MKKIAILTLSFLISVVSTNAQVGFTLEETINSKGSDYEKKINQNNQIELTYFPEFGQMTYIFPNKNAYQAICFYMTLITNTSKYSEVISAIERDGFVKVSFNKWEHPRGQTASIYFEGDNIQVSWYDKNFLENVVKEVFDVEH